MKKGAHLYAELDKADEETLYLVNQARAVRMILCYSDIPKPPQRRTLWTIIAEDIQIVILEVRGILARKTLFIGGMKADVGVELVWFAT